MKKCCKLIVGALALVLGVGLKGMENPVEIELTTIDGSLKVILCRDPEGTARWFGDKYIMTIKDMLENGLRCCDEISFSNFMADTSKARLENKYFPSKRRGVWFVVAGNTTYFGQIYDLDPSRLIYSCSSRYFKEIYLQKDVQEFRCEEDFQSCCYIKQLINVEVADIEMCKLPCYFEPECSRDGRCRFRPRKFLQKTFLENCCKTIDEKFFVHGTTAIHALQFLNLDRTVNKKITFKNEKEFMDFILQASLMHPYNSFQSDILLNEIKFFSVNGSVYKYNPYKKALVKLPTLKTCPQVLIDWIDPLEGLLSVSEG